MLSVQIGPFHHDKTGNFIVTQAMYSYDHACQTELGPTAAILMCLFFMDTAAPKAAHNKI